MCRPCQTPGRASKGPTSLVLSIQEVRRSRDSPPSLKVTDSLDLETRDTVPEGKEVRRARGSHLHNRDSVYFTEPERRQRPDSWSNLAPPQYFIEGGLVLRVLRCNCIYTQLPLWTVKQSALQIRSSTGPLPYSPGW